MMDVESEKREERTPAPLREGVRHGILASLQQDVELRGGRTARLLALAGVVGVLGSLGVTLLISRHPFGHHPPWHLTVISTVWAGLLIVNLAVAFLGIRTPTLPLARAATAGIVGLGLAGLCGAACPDQHYLSWWSGTALGSAIVELAGRAVAAACFGLVAMFGVGAVSAIFTLGSGTRSGAEPAGPALALILLVLPALVLQSYGTSLGVSFGWLAGTAGGAYAGIAAGIRARRMVRR
jgi:hypothetical protein